MSECLMTRRMRLTVMAMAFASLAVAAQAQGVAQQTTPGATSEVVTVGTPALPAGEYLYIAGVEPSMRPAGAPTITEFVKPAGWYEKALHGVSQPYPASLKFLENVGGWWEPFGNPGMHGHYDIRGWHAAN